jgi:hypothetical protein
MAGTLPRLPVDPDLEAAMVALLPHVERLAVIDSQIIAINRGGEGYRQLGPMHERRAACLDNIKGWAKRVNVKPRAMRIFAEEWARLRKHLGRKPSLAQLQRAVIVKQEALQAERVEREALKALADFAAAHAIHRAEAGAEAIIYLENCQ